MTSPARRFKAEADIWAELERQRKERPRYRKVTVTAVDTTNPAKPTFSVAVAGQEDGAVQDLAGIDAAPQFLPKVGDEFELPFIGAVPVYGPTRIAENAVTDVELAPGSVPLEALQFDIDAYAGNKILPGATEPTPPAEGFTLGDIWLKEVAPGPPAQYETWRWNGTIFVKVYDQDVTQALLDAAEAQATADSKTKVYTQATDPNTPPGTLTAANAGEIWRDTGKGNRESVWGTTGTVSRTNWAINPSFEYDPIGTFTLTTAPTSWTRVSGGTLGTLTASIVGGGDRGTKRGKLVASAMRIQTADFMGYQQVVPAVAGDLFRVNAYVFWAVVQANHQIRLSIEWLNVSGTVLGTADVNTAALSAAGGDTLTNAPAAAPANTTSARITVTRRGTAASGTTTATNADLIIDAVLIERNRPSNAVGTYFDGSSQWGTDTVWNGDPNLSTSTIWQESLAGAYAWQPRMLRTGAFEPKSIVAKDIIATGTVSASLMEAFLVLASTVVAGNPAGQHTRMAPGGFYAYRQTGGSNEIATRLGTGTNDYLSIVDSTGAVVSSLDDAGVHSGSKGVFNELVVGGKSLATYLSEAGQDLGIFKGLAPPTSLSVNYGPIGTARVGIAEVNGFLVAGRRYHISWQLAWASDTGNVEGDFAMHVRSAANETDLAPAPVVSVGGAEHWLFNSADSSRWLTAQGVHRFGASVTGHHRFLLSLARGAGVNNVYVISDSKVPVFMEIEDHGLSKPVSGQFSQGGGTFVGGTTPPAPGSPLTQYDTGWLAPTGWKTFRGDFTERTDDITQGWDTAPGAPNGDSNGVIWWSSLPNITGTIDSVYIWLYSKNWYYSSGGTAILNLLPAVPVDGADLENKKLLTGGDMYVAGFPRPGSVQVNFSAHASRFHSNQGASRAMAVSVGNADSTNPLYSGVYDGASARIRIVYTQ